MYLIEENTLGKLRSVYSRRKYEKNTEKSCTWSRFSKIGLNLVGWTDFGGNGLGQFQIRFLASKFSWNAAFDNSLWISLPLSNLYPCFPGRCLSVKESACQCRRHRSHCFHPRIWKIPWRRKEQSTPVFLPGEPHGWEAWWMACSRVSQRVRYNWETEHACMQSSFTFESFSLWLSK